MRRKQIPILILIVLSIIMVYDISVTGLNMFSNIVFRGNFPQSQGGFNIDPALPHVSDSNSLSKSIPSLSELIINNPAGSIMLIANDEDDIHIDYEITVYATTEEDAAEYLKMLYIDVLQIGKQLQLDVKRPISTPTSINGVRVSYKIYAPRRLALDILNRYGPVEIKGFDGYVKARNWYDLLRIEDIDNSIDVECNYGAAEVYNITGNADIGNTYEITDIKGIGGNVMLRTRYSNLTIDQVGGNLKIDTRYGKVSLDNVAGNLEVETNYADLNARRIKGAINILGAYADIEVQDMVRKANIRTRYGDITVGLLPHSEGYTFEGESSYGNITGNIPLVTETVDKSTVKARGTIGEGKYLIKLNVNFGNITITM